MAWRRLGLYQKGMRAIPDLMMALSSLTSDSVRHIRKTAEDPPRVSVLDVISAVTGLDSGNSSNAYARLREQFPEVTATSSVFKFPGRGQRDTPITCVKGAVLIVMLLPGRTAAAVRRQAAGVLCRYLGGDLSLIDELSAIHLAQQDLDEHEPARLFGQQVESDAIKRKREQVVLSELELQLCEQEGALKRRRIESIQHSWSALEACGASDDRDRIRASDMIRTVAFGAPSSPVEKEVCIREVIASAGRTREVGLDCRVGKVAKKLLLAEHPGHVFPKKSIYCNGQQIEANMWLESQRSYIQRALASL